MKGCCRKKSIRYLTKKIWTIRVRVFILYCFLSANIIRFCSVLGLLCCLLYRFNTSPRIYYWLSYCSIFICSYHSRRIVLQTCCIRPVFGIQVFIGPLTSRILRFWYIMFSLYCIERSKKGALCCDRLQYSLTSCMPRLIVNVI